MRATEHDPETPERRLKTLSALGEPSFAEAKTADHVCRTAAATLAQNPHDFPFALIYLLDADGQQARLVQSVGLAGSAHASPRVLGLGSQDDVWNFRQVIAANQGQIVENLQAHVASVAAGPWTDDLPTSALVLPLTKAGVQDAPVGFLVAGISPRMVPTEAYRNFLELAAQQLAAAIANAQAIEEKRKLSGQTLQFNENRLQMAVEAGAIGIWNIDLRTGARIWSNEGKAIYGLAPHEQMDYERQLALIHPDDRAHVHALVTAFRDQGTLKQLNVEHRIVRPDGAVRWVVVRGEAIYDGGELPVRLIGTVLDITERKLNDQRLHRLQHITAALGAALTKEQVAETIVQEVKGDMSAPAGIVFLLSEDGTMLEQITSAGYRRETTEPWLRIPVSTHVPIADCVTSGESVFAENPAGYAARYPERADIAAREGVAAFIAAPLKLDARIVGALGLTFMAPRTFSAEDRAFIEAVARQCAQALERAHLYEAERRARERTERLQSLTTRLATALTLADVVKTVLEEGLPALGAIIGAVMRLDGEELEIVGTVGYPEEVVRPWKRFPLSLDNPLAEVIRTGRAIWLASLEDFGHRDSGLVALAALAAAQSWAALPLVIDGRIVGVLGMGYAEPHVFDIDSRRFAMTLADLCVQALERARLYEAERRARAELAERERHLHLALEAARMVTWRWNPSQDRIETTDNFAAVYGVKAIEYAEQGFALIHPDDLERHRQIVDQAVATQSLYHSEFRIIRPDTGQITWLDERAVPLFDAAGQMQAFAGVVIDITERQRAEEALRRSEARYRQLANSMPQLVWTSDSSGVVDYYNSRVAQYAGIMRTDEGVWDWQPVLHPDDLQPTLDAWQEAARRGQIYAFEHRIQMQDGSFRWHLSRAIPARDRDGQIVKWFGTATDIHEQHQAAQDSRCLADIGEIIRLTADAEVMLERATHMLGEYLQVRRCMVIEIDLAHDLGVIRQQHCRGVPPVAREYQLTAYSADAQVEIDTGHTIVNVDSQIDPRTAALYEATYQPYGERAYVAVPLMRDGVRNGTLWVSDDVPRKWETREVVLLETVAERIWVAIEKLRIEQALRANEERLRVLYIQEQAARAQAEAASRLKDEFLATVSHELRTPLTSILGYAQIIQSRRRDEAYIAQTIEKIVRSAKAQAQLIDDLLDVARIVTGKLRIEPRLMNMDAVIQAAIEALRPAIAAKGIQLAISLDARATTIVGDPNRLQQVVWNLVSNAVKFTPSGGAVWVRLEPSDDHAQLTVGDTGQGISADFLPYVFDRFRQAESTSTRAHGGLGLGLAIVRHLVEMHGGTVHVASPGVGQGATFTVRLPMILVEGAADQGGALDAAKAAGPCPPELAGARVLIVDDQPDIVELLRDLLVPCGAVIRTTTSARDALAILRDWQPDVLVSDIAMPGEDGYWLIRSLRALAPEDGGGIPAVALTAYVRMEDRLQVLAAGFQLYVPKPVDPAEFLDAVARMAKAHASGDS